MQHRRDVGVLGQVDDPPAGERVVEELDSARQVMLARLVKD